MNTIKPPKITVPLGMEAHRKAQEFAAEQITPRKRKKVYLNTLAVYAVHNFLNWLQIETDLNSCDSWHPGLRALFDVADLVLPGLGKLECCPIAPTEVALTLAPEATVDRIGYIGVQFEESLEQVHLLGFVPSVETLNQSDQLQIAEFQTIDTFLDHIHVLLSNVPSTQKPTLVNLQRWFENIFDNGWLLVETLLNTESTNLAFNFRAASNSNVQRAKQIDLISTPVAKSVFLVVALTRVTLQEIGIMVGIHPISGQIYLPAQLKLMVLNSDGISVMQATASDANKNIKLYFSGVSGERFSVKVTLENASVTENFVI